MSTTSETVPAPSSEEGRVQSDQSKFVQHLATYPAVTALAGLIASFPVAKIFASNAIPLLHAIHERSKSVADPIAQTATPYLRSLDTVGDNALSKVDERFPQLQKVQPSEVYESAQNYIDSVKGNAKAKYDDRIVKPFSNAASAARNQYESIYDSQIGSYVSPINERLESAIDQYLPQESETEADQAFENSEKRQVRRTYALAKLAAERAAPKLKEVYVQKLDARTAGEKNPGYVAKLLAALATGKFLSVESYNLVLSHFGTPGRLEAAVDEVKAKAEEYRMQAEKAADGVVDSALNAAN